jgi:hypothetical protein
MMQWDLKRGLGAGAALLLLLLIAVAIYLHSSQGPDEFLKMDHALRLAQSWRSHRVMNEPGRSNDQHMEVYCPTSVHIWQTSTSAGRPPQESETIDTMSGSYVRNGTEWMVSGFSERMISSPCSWGPRGADDFLGTLDVVVQSGRIHRGETRRVNGDLCRDWTASVPAPAGWRDAFVACIDDRHLPLEVAAPDRSLVITYSDWNKPILIETPPLPPRKQSEDDD